MILLLFCDRIRSKALKEQGLEKLKDLSLQTRHNSFKKCSFFSQSEVRDLMKNLRFDSDLLTETLRPEIEEDSPQLEELSLPDSDKTDQPEVVRRRSGPDFHWKRLEEEGEESFAVSACTDLGSRELDVDLC